MNNLPALYPGRLHLLLALQSARFELVNALVARLACSGPLLVLDGGNCFQAHRLARRTGLMLGGKLIELTDTPTFFSNPSDPRTSAFVRGDMVY